MRHSLYVKIFLWFCGTIVVTFLVVVATATLFGAQPFGRKWMAVSQDLYAHSAVDFYETGGAPALNRYLDRLTESSGFQGQLLDAADHDVLGASIAPEVKGVLAEAHEIGRSSFHIGRVWSAASPVEGAGGRYTFVIHLHPSRQMMSGTFARIMIPRLLLGLLLVALCCLMLARHITRPIQVLEEAATQLAAGSLDVRAGPRMVGRRDELARMGASFDDMAERIQRLILTQQEMLGHISHELRSPLTRMGVSLELLRRGEGESLEQMQVDLDRLNQMIGEILELTRMDLQERPRTPDAVVELRPLLLAIAQDAAFEAREQGQTVVCQISEPCNVRGDATMLRSCFENIVRNALLHTPREATIRIELGCDEHIASVVIADDGGGVAEHALPHLFELFYRSGETSAMHPEGTGFGLAIAQRIVARHGGTIRANNLVPRGLELRIELPLADPKVG